MIKMKKQNIIPIIALLALVSMMIVPVCAETLTGTLGGSTFIQTAFTGNVGSPTNSIPTMGYINDIQNSAALYTVVVWPKHVFSVDAGAPTGNTVPFTAYLKTSYSGVRVDNNPVGTGIVGYQQIWDNSVPPVQQTTGYYYVVFYTWNITGRSGDYYIEMNYTSTAGFYNLSGSHLFSSVVSDIPSGFFGLGSVGSNGMVYGDYLESKSETVSADYTVTKPSGIGITGAVTKTGNSRVIIQNSTLYTVAAENLASSNTFQFGTNAPQIYVKILTPGGSWYNSSLLFSAPVTPTPTPTPITTIPAGYVRNNLYIWDQNDAQITGADVDVRDVENASWTNTTADADGWITIDTLPYHTVNVYAHYPTAGIYLPNEILGLETGYYGGHNWVLVLYPYVTTPSGFVTLYINTRNYDTKAVLTGVNLQIKNLVTGAITGGSTGSTDSVSTVVTNATNYQITGSKSGYLSKTININSGEASSKTVVVELSKATVTTIPTATPGPGGTTPVYVDPNDPSLHGGDTSLKAGEMMTWLAMHGMDLVQLCFLVTIFALLGVKPGK